MKKWIVLALVVVLAFGGYVAAGPWLAIKGIRDALATQDVAKLERHVDFPALRVNLRSQLEDRLARQAGPDMQSGLLGAFALGLANQAMGAGVDTLVTPTGIGALLQGRSMWKQAVGDTVDGDTWSAAKPADPLREASHRYESPSRFTATVTGEDGKPLVFVFTRDGLSWRLSNVLLPAP